MDRLRLASFHCLLILSCGDVERNPGPPPELAPRSEVLRRFTRCIQSELVKHIYQANNHDLPTHLYERDPPGWNKFDKKTAFENICNIQKGGSQTFDKLVKLFKKDVRPIPTDILDVIVCYEKLRDSKKNSDETKKWKVALENYVSQNKSMKNKQAVIDNLDDNLLIEVLKKAAEKAKQGNIGSTDDGVNNVIVAIEQVLDAILEHNTNQTVEKSKLSGKKRQATETVTKIQQVKRKKCFSSCQYKGTGVKGKKKSKGIAKKGAIAIVTQELDIQPQQQSEPFMNIFEPGNSIEDSQGDQSNMAVLYAPNSEPPFPECLSDIVPEIEQYQLYSLPSPPHCNGIIEDSFISNINQVSETDTVSFLMDQETLDYGSVNHSTYKFGIDQNQETNSFGISSPEQVSAFSSVNDADHGNIILQDGIPSTVLDDATIPEEPTEIQKIVEFLRAYSKTQLDHSC